MNDRLADSLGFTINKAAILLKDELGCRSKGHRITVEQWRLLRRLWDRDGLTQKELAEQIYKDQPNTAHILDKLQGKGIIRRFAGPCDRRSFLIQLTEEGKALQRRLQPVALGLSADAFQGIAEEQRQVLKELLARICLNVEKAPRE
jgi:DNA-binding MarR family transcriptional regulator